MGRISAGTIIVGLFAVMFGLTGAYAAKKYFEPQQVAQIPPRVPPPAAVPLASTDLVVGRQVTLGDIMLVRLTPKQIKERNLPPEYMTSAQQIIGRVLRVPLKKGEAFETSALYPEGMSPSLADRLKPGYRAVTIPVKQDVGVGSVSGFTVPGTMVDVLFRINRDTEGQPIPETTFMLLNNAEVLATGPNSVPGGANKNLPFNVTLAVTPEQANRLKVVEGRGELSLVLRSTADNELADMGQGLTLDNVLGLPKKPEVVVAQPFVTEIYRGGSRQTLQFDRDQVIKDVYTGPDRPATGPVAQPVGQVVPPVKTSEVPPDASQLK